MNVIRIFIIIFIVVINISGCRHGNHCNELIFPFVIDNKIEPDELIDHDRNYTDRYISDISPINKKKEEIEVNDNPSNVLYINNESSSANEFDEKRNYNDDKTNNGLQNKGGIQEYKENKKNDNATIKITYFRIELNDTQNNESLNDEDSQEESTPSIIFTGNEKPEDHKTLIDYIPEDEKINYYETIIYKEDTKLSKKNINDDKKIFYPKYVFGSSKVIIKEFLTKTEILNKAGISFFSRFFSKIAEKDAANQEIDINNIAISTMASDYETIKSFIPIHNFPGSTILVPATSTAIVINNDKALDVFKHLTAIEVSQTILNSIQYMYLGKTIEQQECNTYKFIELIHIKAITEVAASYIEYYLVEDLDTFVMLFFIIIQI